MLRKKTLFCLFIASLIAASVCSANDRPLGIDPEWDGISNPHPELARIGDKFSFAVNADPQVGHYNATETMYINSNYNISTTVKQLNDRKPEIDFLVYLGDVVNVPDEASFDNFLKRNAPFKNLTILNHGNHDTIPPYTRFRDYEELINGIRSVYYSFDAGKWHFITIPANNEFGNYDNLEVTRPMLEWLREDLRKNKDRPTMIFVHLHMMPQGLSQLEWYTYSPDLKHELIEVLSEHGNVKYYFNGHVHNGIKVSHKTAWTYKGINFITLPSGTAPRPFGEEFEEFKEGLEKGGYYTIFDIDGEDVTITSRNVYSDAKFTYPKNFREFHEDIEPKLLYKIIDLPARPVLVNGGFENGLDGWFTPYRYNCDGLETGFINECRMKHKFEGIRSGYVYAKPLGSHWLQDEYNEFYQIVKAPPGDSPVFEASYLMEDDFEAGGGYLRLIAVGGPEGKGDFKFLMQFDFSDPEHQRDSDYYSRAIGYTIQGRVSNWLYLQNIGAKKQGLFIDVPQTTMQWHHIKANIADIYNQSVGKKNAYQKLGVTRFIVAGGVFCVKDVTRGAGTFIDEIKLRPGTAQEPSTVDGEAIIINDDIFKCKFGQGLEDKVRQGKG